MTLDSSDDVAVATHIAQTRLVVDLARSPDFVEVSKSALKAALIDAWEHGRTSWLSEQQADVQCLVDIVVQAMGGHARPGMQKTTVGETEPILHRVRLSWNLPSG